MKCVQCGLVHSPLEPVCRRCEIDLKTGEKRSRAGLCPLPELETPKPGRFARGSKAVSAAPASGPKLEASAKVSLKDLKPTAKPGGPTVEVLRAEPDEDSDFPVARVPAAASGAVREIPCVQCGSRMTVKKQVAYSPAWPIVLFAAGAAILILGIVLKADLVFIMAAASVAAGFIYLRIGKTFWKCDACGFIVPRA